MTKLGNRTRKYPPTPLNFTDLKACSHFPDKLDKPNQIEADGIHIL